MREEVEAANQARRAAMVAGDIAALERLVDENAIYIHTNGWRETGAEYLDAVRRRKYTYVGADLSYRRVRVIGDVGIVSGLMTLTAKVEGGTLTTVDIQCVEIWERRTDGWIMIHYQGTRPATD